MAAFDMGEYKRSILFVTHNIEEALYLADRIVVFSEKPVPMKTEFIFLFQDQDKRIFC